MDRVFHSKLLTILLIASILLLGLPFGAAMSCQGSGSAADCCCETPPAPTGSSGCCDEEDAQPGPMPSQGVCACSDMAPPSICPERVKDEGRGGIDALDEEWTGLLQSSPRPRLGRSLPLPKARTGPPLYLLGQVYLI